MVIGAAADEIIAELGYYTSEKKLDRRNVIVRLDAVWRFLLSNALYMGTYAGDAWRFKVDKEFTEPQDNLYISRVAPVLYDNVRQAFYSVMPTELVSWHSYDGIRQIKAVQTNTSAGILDAPMSFTKVRNGGDVAYGLLESAMLFGGVGYMLEGQQVYYTNMPLNIYTSVLMTYIPALTGLKETDVLPISSEFEHQLLTMTKQEFMLQRQIPENKTTDANSE